MEQKQFMKFNLIGTITRCLLILTLFATTMSCGNTKKVLIFPDVKDGNIPSTTPYPETVIQKSDILSINVSSLNPEASQIFNAPMQANAGGGGAAQAGDAAPAGYLVDNDGNIEFPVLGKMKAQGLTKNQLKDKIANSLVEKKLLLD